MSNIYKLVILCLVFALSTGCSHIHRGRIIGDAKLSADVKERMLMLQEITERKDEPALKAKAHLELVQIYYQFNNLDLNYARALEELEKYVALEPEKSNTFEIRNQLAVLRELEREKKAGIRLKKENAEMAEIINKLNLLDVQLEKKREMMKQREP